MSMRYAAGFISAFYNPLQNPNAPTIGTATAGISAVSVAFTAPSNVGGSAITAYTVQATKTSDGSITYTSGTSSPILVTGLSGTAYTFKVLATNSYGSSQFSASSNSATPLVIGGAYEGGFFAGQIGVSGVATHNLVIGPVASAQTTNKKWKTSATSTTGTSSNIDGPTNSANMNNASHPAAEFCEAVTAGGYTDWYMPAKNELEVCYFNLKPTTTVNDTTQGGSNANAVPVRGSNYTSGTPAQTSAADFKDSGTEFFSSAFYWSSTQNGALYGWSQTFNNGAQVSNYKLSGYRVRAIRRVAV